jgi:hypothetical protein
VTVVVMPLLLSSGARTVRALASSALRFSSIAICSAVSCATLADAGIPAASMQAAETAMTSLRMHKPLLQWQSAKILPIGR